MTKTAEMQADGTDIWSEVIGQPHAVSALTAAARSPVHAYLFCGPRGSGKRAAARAFTAVLLGNDERSRRLALDGRHPDVSLCEPEGRTLRVSEAEQIIFEASRSPVEGDRKVIVCDRFHTAEPEAVASLLKTIEEPPESTVIVLLSEEKLPEHATVASRCVLVEFDPLPDDVIRQTLASQGASAELLDDIVAGAAGDLVRARLLLSDQQLHQRRLAWAAVPGRLDGTGATVAVVADELRTLIDDAQMPLTQKHKDEAAALEEQEKQFGTSGSGRRDMETRHRRELRQLRDDELRFGFATLAAHYRDRLADGGSVADAAAVDRIRETHAALVRNPNEALLLEALLLALSPS